MSAPKIYIGEAAEKQAEKNRKARYLRQPKNKATHNAYTKKYRTTHPEQTTSKQQAYRLARREAEAGRVKSKTCEVCGAGGRIFYDHDHQTGKFRGWICHPCNATLGFARDRVEVLQKLIAYLQANSLFK